MLSGTMTRLSVEEGSQESGEAFNILPEGLRRLFGDMNSTMSDILAENLSEGPLTSILINNPLLVLAVFFVIAFSISLFINFIQDVWKMPIAVLLDILVIMSLPDISLLSFIGGVGSFLFFVLLFHDMEKLKWVFGGVCFLNAVLPISMIAMVPLTSILGIVAAFITR
ncbi:MAG: hypothetical protein ACLFTR_02435 [Candidatus Woesearchaeota archaeon]